MDIYIYNEKKIPQFVVENLFLWDKKEKKSTNKKREEKIKQNELFQMKDTIHIEDDSVFLIPS